jgi:hypothetical protein
LPTYLYSSSTIAAGSICSIASSKYPSSDGKKSLSFDLHASRLFGQRFQSFVSSALLRKTKLLQFLQLKHYKTEYFNTFRIQVSM